MKLGIGAMAGVGARARVGAKIFLKSLYDLFIICFNRGNILESSEALLENTLSITTCSKGGCVFLGWSASILLLSIDAAWPSHSRSLMEYFCWPAKLFPSSTLHGNTP